MCTIIPFLEAVTFSKVESDAGPTVVSSPKLLAQLSGATDLRCSTAQADKARSSTAEPKRAKEPRVGDRCGPPQQLGGQRWEIFNVGLQATVDLLQLVARCCDGEDLARLSQSGRCFCHLRAQEVGGGFCVGRGVRCWSVPRACALEVTVAGSGTGSMP